MKPRHVAALALVGWYKESRNEVCPRHPMPANRSFRVIRRATIAFSPNIVQTVAGGPAFGRRALTPALGEKTLTAHVPVGHARYPALGAGSGKSGAVTSRALYVSPDPAPSPPLQIWHASHSFVASVKVQE